MIRIIDESGEEYLYPQEYFVEIKELMQATFNRRKQSQGLKPK